jgi:hypothetical protein
MKYDTNIAVWQLYGCLVMESGSQGVVLMAGRKAGENCPVRKYVSVHEVISALKPFTKNPSMLERGVTVVGKYDGVYCEHEVF